jgi:hypothetical protein
MQEDGVITVDLIGPSGKLISANFGALKNDKFLRLHDSDHRSLLLDEAMIQQLVDAIAKNLHIVPKGRP